MIQLLVDFAQESEKKRLYGLLKNLKAVKHFIEIKQFRNKRSDPQNRFYWGTVVKLLSLELGYHPEEIHEILKQKFLPKEIVLKQTGEVYKVGTTTTDLDTKEFEEYLEKIKMFAVQELDIYIPDPS